MYCVQTGRKARQSKHATSTAFVPHPTRRRNKPLQKMQTHNCKSQHSKARRRGGKSGKGKRKDHHQATIVVTHLNRKHGIRPRACHGGVFQSFGPAKDTLYFKIPCRLTYAQFESFATKSALGQGTTPNSTPCRTKPLNGKSSRSVSKGPVRRG